MRRQEQVENFQSNLRLMCENTGSISEACRRIGISRTQMNKYLSGIHLPSQRNIERIAHFFKVDESELFLPSSQMAQRLSSFDYNITKGLRTSQRFINFGQQHAAAIRKISEYYGVYERYHYSSIYSGRVLRSIVCIFPRDGMPHHYYVERFPSYDDPGKSDYTFKYHGLTTMLGERLIMVDFETIQRNEMTYAILVPSHRNKMQFLFGITTGIAATLHREPFSTRVALHRRDSGLIKKSHLKRARTLHPDDASIPFEIKEHLGKQANIIRGS